MVLKKLREKLKWLDPFTYVDIYLMPKVNPNDSEAISWVVYLVSAFFFAWVIYTGLGVVLSTPSPMMIVVSSSMEPVLQRGDIVVLVGASPESLSVQEIDTGFQTLKQTDFSSFANPVYLDSTIQSIEFDSGQTIQVNKEGDIVVYWSDLMQEPIIHRAVVKLLASDNTYLLTKGDSLNNSTIDQDCGRVVNQRPEKPCIELYPVPMEKLQGKVLLHLPLLGCAKLWIVDDLGSLISKGRLPDEFEPGNVC